MNQEKELSKELFAIIKPKCVHVSELVLTPPSSDVSNANELTLALKSVYKTLNDHRTSFEKKRINGVYRISDKLADYIFFPISNLLAQKIDSPNIKRYVLGIIGFLVHHSWSFDINPVLIDQLYQLVNHLIKNVDLKKLATEDEQIEFEFKKESISCLKYIIGCLTNNTFEPSLKNMSLFGSSITFLLTALTNSTNPRSVEEIAFVIDCFDLLDILVSLDVSDDEMSRILPGVVSQVINFYILSKNLHYSIICRLISSIGTLIIKVYDDKSLELVINKTDFDLNDLASIWDQKKSPPSLNELNISINNSKIRSKEWLKASSKQLKLSLTILFKDLVSRRNYIKVKTKNEIGRAIINFIAKIYEKCFFALFNEIIPLSLDVISLLIAIEDSDCDLQSYYHDICAIICLDDNTDEVSVKRSFLFDFLRKKIDDLIQIRLSNVLKSVDDDRIGIFLTSIKFHFALLYYLSDILYSGTMISEDLMSEFLIKFKSELHSSFNSFGNKKIGKNDLISALSLSRVPQVTMPKEGSQMYSKVEEEGEKDEEENKLDDVQLPGYINASNITNITSKGKLETKALEQSYKMLNSLEINLNNNSDVFYLQGLFTSSIELQIVSMFKFLASLTSKNYTFKVLYTLLQSFHVDISETDNHISRAFGLWIANSFLDTCIKSGMPDDNFDPDQFLQFENEEKSTILMAGSSESDDVVYQVLESSLTLIDELSDTLRNPFATKSLTSIDQKKQYKVYEVSYSMALDSIGVLSDKMTIEDFQQDILQDYLFTILEALTFQSSPLIQSQAMKTLKQIVKKHYDDSIEKLIVDNSDYLVDSISIKLSTSSSLTPSLPGIFLVILKISGIKLLLTNQLNDVLTELFTLVDSYHGYSLLMEGFFAVFEEVIRQIDMHYSVLRLQNTNINGNSKFKPWGLTSIDELFKLLDDSHKIIDPFDKYDSSKEYFKKRKDLPFSEQDSDDEDSDDEVDGENEQPIEEESRWSCYIPQNIYQIVEKIFNYGFRLLTHPSLSLKYKILNILRKLYPILGCNYSSVLPLVSKNWSILMPMTIGSSTLSTTKNSMKLIHGNKSNTDTLIEPALELIICFIDEDSHNNDTFLAQKIIELWDYWQVKLPMFNVEKSNVKGRKVSTMQYNPKIIELYIKVISRSLEVYERVIPDVVAFKMTKICYQLGIKDSLVNMAMENNMWVLQKTVAG